MTKRALIISGIFWDDTWQRHQNIATALADQGYSIDFVSGIKSSGITINKCLEVLSNKLNTNKNVNVSTNKKPKLINEISAFNLPYRGALNNYTGRKITSVLNDYYDVVICYIPAPISLKIIKSVKYKTLVYDCVRNFEQWPGIAPSVLSAQCELVTMADQVWVDSFYLYNQLSKQHNNVTQILPTIDKEIDTQALEKTNINKLAFFGSVSSHFDTNILTTLSELGIELYIWGKDELCLSEQYEFVHYKGYVTSEQQLLSSILTETDGIIIPYKGGMDGVIPAKIMQSLSTYLPVFISSFYDSRQLTDYLYCYQDQQQLSQQLRDFDFAKHDQKRNKIKSFIASNTQKALEEKVLSLIEC